MEKLNFIQLSDPKLNFIPLSGKSAVGQTTEPCLQGNQYFFQFLYHNKLSFMCFSQDNPKMAMQKKDL